MAGAKAIPRSGEVEKRPLVKLLFDEGRRLAQLSTTSLLRKKKIVTLSCALNGPK